MKKIEQGDSAKKKEQGNGRKRLKVLIFTIVAIVGFLIVTGAWNSFESKEASEEAIEVYEKSGEVIKNMAPDVFGKESLENSYWLSIYGEETDSPYGLDVTDYGTEGKNGCLKETFTACMSYDTKYGLNFYTYYMKNEDYAKDKYAGEKGSLQADAYYSKEEDIPNGKVYSYAMTGGLNIHFVVRQGTVVYHFYGDPGNLGKMQPLFDNLNIKFKVPKKLTK